MKKLLAILSLSITTIVFAADVQLPPVVWDSVTGQWVTGIEYHDSVTGKWNVYETADCDKRLLTYVTADTDYIYVKEFYEGSYRVTPPFSYYPIYSYTQKKNEDGTFNGYFVYSKTSISSTQFRKTITNIKFK